MVLEIWSDPDITAKTGYEYTRAIQFQCLGRVDLRHKKKQGPGFLPTLDPHRFRARWDHLYGHQLSLACSHRRARLAALVKDVPLHRRLSTLVDPSAGLR